MEVKKVFLAAFVVACALGSQAQSDLSVGTQYQLNLQRQNAGQDAFILHNAQYSSALDVLSWNTSHSNFGSRGIRFTFASGGGIFFYADNAATTSGSTFTPTTRMFISNNGNVGIGTTSPQALLHVAGTSFLGTSGNELYISSGTTSFGTQAGIRNNGGDVVFNSKNGGTLYLNRDVAADVKIQTFNSTTSSFVDIATFLQNGKVGIGTTQPDYPLTVNGSIHAKEVRVDLNVPAPDYVFEKDYKLTSLEDVKTYIDQNKHLPEVPSAKEIEKNGVQLGEMNLILLKKIEELTLYVIELKKEITALKEDKTKNGK